MKNSREMRREAWGILKGKWFWRLLCVAVLLQLISSFVNGLISGAFKVMSITSVGDYVVAKANAAKAGLAYSLPTMKAYYWMVGGFMFQTFIAYIFAAILAFGFMGLLLKASKDDDARWFSDAFGGFARPLEITWLLALMNAMVLLAVAAFGAVLVPAALVAAMRMGLDPLSRGSLAIVLVAVVVAVVCAFPVMYAYRQAWFLKNERPEASAVECLRESRRMMKGFKWRAFCLDFSFIGWILVAVGLFFFASLGVALNEAYGHATRLAGAVSGAIAFGFGFAAFWLTLRVVLGMCVARVVFYRELQGCAPQDGIG